MNPDLSIIEPVVTAALEARLKEPEHRAQLMAGLPDGFVQSLPVIPRPRDQLRGDILELFRTKELAGISVAPLAIWLANAERIAFPRPQASKFRDLRIRLGYGSPRQSRPPLGHLVDRLQTVSRDLRNYPPGAVQRKPLEVEQTKLIDEIVSGAQVVPGDRIANSELEAPIGVGGFATVWRARDLDTGETVATKVFQLSRLSQPTMLFRFRRGIKAMKILAKQRGTSPAGQNVVRIRHVDESTLAFSMDYHSGGNFTSVAEHEWDRDTRLGHFIEICSAVAFAHRNAVIHRDIKPGNILLDKSGRPVLTDFDIADIQIATNTSVGGGGFGTIHFAAPEQLEDLSKATERSDIYSLGRLLHFLLIQRRLELQFESEPNLGNLASEPATLVEVVRRATRMDPRERFGSVHELVQAVEDHQTGWAAWRVRFRRAGRAVRQHRLLIFTSLVLIGAAVTIAIREGVRAAQLQDLTSQLRKSNGDLEQALSTVTEEKQRASAAEAVAKRDRDVANAAVVQLGSQLDEFSRLVNSKIGLSAQVSRTRADIEQLKAKLTVASGRRERERVTQRLEQKRERLDTLTAEGESLDSEIKLARLEHEKQVDRIRRMRSKCSNSNECRTHGLCIFEDGRCQATQDLSCEVSIRCKRSGACGAVRGKCRPTSARHCEESDDCRIHGRCAYSGKQCVASRPEHCLDSEMCRQRGLCSMNKGECLALDNNDCRSSKECRLGSRCYAAQGTCQTRSFARENVCPDCFIDGRCAYQGSKCVAVSSESCRRSVRCRGDGLCTAVDGRCIAADDADCESSCSDFGGCKAVDGKCTSPIRPAPHGTFMIP